ncbi:MAG: hypothetical protein AAF492_08695, partial [Verrucomicrobiota bacterium]
GTLHFAGDFNNALHFAPGDGVINGIPFTRIDEDVPGLFSTDLNFGPFFGSNTFFNGPSTGDIDLDDLLDSHAWLMANPGTATFTIEGLTIGTTYQVQLINPPDTRPFGVDREYEPDNGMGVFNTGVILRRGNIESVIGRFTADAATQSILFRSLGNNLGEQDPALAGVVIFAVPEPSTFFYLLIALVAVRAVRTSGLLQGTSD